MDLRNACSSQEFSHDRNDPESYVTAVLTPWRCSRTRGQSLSATSCKWRVRNQKWVMASSSDTSWIKRPPYCRHLIVESSVPPSIPAIILVACCNSKLVVSTNIRSLSSLLEQLLLDELSYKQASFSNINVAVKMARLVERRRTRIDVHRQNDMTLRNGKSGVWGYKSCLGRNLCKKVPLREDMTWSDFQEKFFERISFQLFPYSSMIGFSF